LNAPIPEFTLVRTLTGPEVSARVEQSGNIMAAQKLLKSAMSLRTLLLGLLLLTSRFGGA
jgi:hypothetical protein